MQTVLCIAAVSTVYILNKEVFVLAIVMLNNVNKGDCEVEDDDIDFNQSKYI